jgi:hypothetical protein
MVVVVVVVVVVIVVVVVVQRYKVHYSKIWSGNLLTHVCTIFTDENYPKCHMDKKYL